MSASTEAGRGSGGSLGDPLDRPAVTACVLDVNETMLDLSALDGEFERLFGDPDARREWFSQMLLCGLTATATGAYVPLADAGAAALRMLAERRRVILDPERSGDVLGRMRSLPAHPEVGEGLAALADAGFRLAALTNSTLEVAREQLENAGLAPRFELVLSADQAGRLKPAPEPYLLAAERLGVRIGELRMIAAHGWDVTGAIRAGARAAFVARPGMVLDPVGELPDVIGSDLREVAAAVVGADAPL